MGHLGVLMNDFWFWFTFHLAEATVELALVAVFFVVVAYHWVRRKMEAAP